MATPPAPNPPPEPDPDTLAGKVFAALYALPPQFESDLNISGVRATDLFTFNASLGATIEEQVVDALNALRTSTWDQDEQYAQYRFVRQPQTFPDVVLRAAAPGVTPEILFGIELKGWYVLAKEREPSFRYRVTPAVCAPDDFLAVFPWALSRVVSGSPQLFHPMSRGRLTRPSTATGTGSTSSEAVSRRATSTCQTSTTTTRRRRRR